VAALTAWTAFAAGVATEDLELELLLEALFQRFGVDFRGYARPALRRKLGELMRAQELATVSRLQERVLHESGAVAGVLRALAVAPAGLFGAPEHARQLAGVLAPCLRASAVPKVWLAECAGVGEAWTLAVLLADLQLLARTQVYATVSNEELLAEAVDATLPAESMAQYQQNYELAGGTGTLADYFELSDGRASLLPQLKDHITWAQYSLVTDASFNEFEAIVCAGALADFGPVLRQRVLRLFHESLALFGVLGIDRELSPSDACFDRYQQVVPGAPWYKRIA
jgi:chemotaxis protein methyltransferase CheR